ncbi:asparagine synthase (glutamine-hydrolyzing) [Caulobacter sp. 17J80-11]|uniref:asparagine synthase (glutamine-hydrolyzing) n=1 Tax=Caulobacter sp. 17J80-11 TaxID=2763502 RepID=UPI00165365B5|nr:asparagine synthase (glutamine-hydrolyzing) [Caulobacter sp. 17J80-11]MBC6982609.1 asparagine synthase (glutamine-hydrolyzing) [Caulobacter sp. 17J80-11]
MCGIAGVLGRGAEPGAARPLIESIAHRGPDGVRVEDGPGWSLGHARLSIIDLEGGWQPLHLAGSTLIGNGEIYNYVELTAEYDLDAALQTGSDFEPLLHIYSREGSSAFERLRGMFALCLVGADGVSWLVRDGFGIKPLYYTWDGPTLRFASEPRALLPRTGRTLVQDRVEELLALNYTLGEDTIFKGVSRMSPGRSLEIRPGRDWAEPGDVDQVWLAAEPIKFNSLDDALEQLDAVLEDSVRVHQRADVPYGLFLSGGIDSAVIATVMSRLNERPVTAFTCGFEAEGARDERARAEAVARALNLDWRETSFGEEDFWRLLPKVAWALDEPTTDYASLPTYKLAEAAKGTLTVVLTGEGGDELFAGYGRYRRSLRARWLGGRPAEPQVDAPFLRDGGEGALERWREIALDWSKSFGSTPLQAAQIADIKTWLHADLLLKLDRCLMAHGLEGRTPFLDNRVAAFAFHLPDRLKVQGRLGKWLLRKWLERHCPAADPFARKMGFTVPVGAWIAPRAADLGPKIAAVQGVAEACDVEAVRAVFARPDHVEARWPLLFYAVWWLIHVGGAEPQAALKELVGEP